MQAFGGLRLTVDGNEVRPADTLAYKGMMLSDVPNFAFAIGYTNSSWTLKIGLLCEHLCRLLAHLDAHGYDTCRPEPADPRWRPARSWTSGPGTSGAPSTRCPARATGSRG